MRYSTISMIMLVLSLSLSGCGSSDDDDGTVPLTAVCSDGIDNDADGLIDFPDDPGCASAADTEETDPALAACADGLDNDNDSLIDFPSDPGCASISDDDETQPACSDGLDNDSDGLVDFPNDPGCSSASDSNEIDSAVSPVCADGVDNDGDGKTDHPDDPGCTSAADTDETDPTVTPLCSDGLDNDSDGLIDFPDDKGCINAADNDETDPPPADSKTRYSMNNQCWAVKANGSGNYLVRSETGYTATATNMVSAEPFYMKPSALGKYLFYNSNRQLMSRDGSSLAHVASVSATDDAEWTIVGVGDSTEYPPTPAYHEEPTPEEVQAYHGFIDPNLVFSNFTVYSATADGNLAVRPDGSLQIVAADSDADNESFSFEPMTGCAVFPEASSDFSGTPFKGRRSDGTVLGHTDAHVHISATEFLGGAEWGRPYHKFGVEHALGDCDEIHGPNGTLDALGTFFTNDFDGHDTSGWPNFVDWPARSNLTHEAIYWKWLERSWAAGLRIVVNDLVDNETLCELQRNLSGDPALDCNSMNNAGRQVGTMYGMQDYIDAQYGGRGEGFFQIVHDPIEARQVVEDGNMAVVLGIEISNLFDCKITYSPNPLRQPPETEDGSGGAENAYGCTTAEGQPNSILTQMERIHDWGVRQVISIHEFDNAFGGNGIFDGAILNLGNRENSGGIPSGDVAGLLALLSPDLTPEQLAAVGENLPTTELGTGEFWTTYDCPVEDVTPGFSGYLWGSTGGSAQEITIDPFCVPLGFGGRAGGATPCYPRDVRQCNARWMTPAGLYTYKKMMEMGFLFDWDHMEVGMKTQALELAEAQDPPYPFVSTHGTFGGTTIDQATRLLKNGGFLYPSNGSSSGFRSDMDETFGIYETAMTGVPTEDQFLFGFGYGTDTNGLSAQTRPGSGVVTYPYTLFSGSGFDQLSEFTGVAGVVFRQPSSKDADGNVVRTWNQNLDGNAHHGMLSGFVEEIRKEGSPEQIRHLFNSAEAYLQTWERTEAAKAGILSHGSVQDPVDPVLRPSPPVGDFAP